MRTPPRLVLITGAGSGIGRATAQRFAADGAEVIVTDIDENAAGSTADTITAAGGAATAYRLDVTSHDQWRELADTVAVTHGAVDVLVNNAGITTAGAFFDHGTADWEMLLAVNVKGVVHGSRVLARQMIEAGVHGQIINVASAAAYTPILLSSPYCATKAAVKMFSECLRMELAPHHIGVSAICPGMINTDFYSSACHVGDAGGDAEFRKTMSVGMVDHVGHGPDTIARAIVKAARTNPAIQPVTLEARLTWALSRLSPAAMRLLARATSGDVVSSAARKYLPAAVRDRISGAADRKVNA